MSEQRELSGVLNRNDKRDNPARPDYKGSATIDGTSYWISGWIKDGASSKFMSLSFEVKSEAPKQENGSFDAPADDGIPF